MYCKYVYVAGATNANILADVVALITGSATLLSQLSAACDQGASTLVTTTPGGWTTHDSVSSTRMVVTQPPHDTGAGYTVNVYADLDITSANNLYIKLWEGWNNVSHVGTNMAEPGGTVGMQPRTTAAAGGTLYISSSSLHLAILSNTAAGFGSSTGNGTLGVFQRARFAGESPALGLSPAINTNTGTPAVSNSGVPRVWNTQTQQFVTGSSAIAYMSTVGPTGVSGPSAANLAAVAVGPDAVQRLYFMVPRLTSTTAPSNIDLGTIKVLRFSPSLGATLFDTATVNGVTYECWLTSITSVPVVWVPRQ